MIANNIEAKFKNAIDWRGIDAHELARAKNSQYYYFIGVKLSKNNSLLDVEIWTNTSAVGIPYLYQVVWTAGGNRATVEKEVTTAEVKQVKNEILRAILAHIEQTKK